MIEALDRSGPDMSGTLTVNLRTTTLLIDFGQHDMRLIDSNFSCCFEHCAYQSVGLHHGVLSLEMHARKFCFVGKSL